MGADSPQMRACSLGYAGRDYLRACHIIRLQRDPFFNFLLPTMHQTFELLTKAIVFKVDPAFDPRKFKHQVKRLVNKYAGKVSLFDSMIADGSTVTLMRQLEKSYLGVRYGECTIEYDGDVWTLFAERSVQLLDDLSDRTGVPFLDKHFPKSG
jgi:hypothetical protein